MTKSGSDLQIGRRAALTLFASLAAGATARAADDWAEVEPAARKEGRVVLYHNMRPQGAEICSAPFGKPIPASRPSTSGSAAPRSTSVSPPNSTLNATSPT